MKAFLLAAGLGTRLRPLTDSVPKCLIPIGEKPLLEHWLERCDRYGIDEVLINGHYLADQVEEYIADNKKRFAVRIVYVYEPELKGTGGTLKTNFDFVRNEDHFYAFHCDVFTDIHLENFRQFHVQRRSPLTIALDVSDHPHKSGVVEGMTKEKLITAFREKPQDPKTNIVSAAMFLMSPEVSAYFPKEDNFDFSAVVLPRLVGKMYGYFVSGYRIDVGSMESLEQANLIAKKWA